MPIMYGNRNCDCPISSLVRRSKPVYVTLDCKYWLAHGCVGSPDPSECGWYRSITSGSVITWAVILRLRALTATSASPREWSSGSEKLSGIVLSRTLRTHSYRIIAATCGDCTIPSDQLTLRINGSG